MRSREYSHPALTEFASIAREFCDVVENSSNLSPENLLAAIHRLLPRAYAAALLLPDTAVLFDDSDDSQTEENAAQVREASTLPPGISQLADFLGARRFYREIFDPYAESGEPEVGGDIIDDLSDIYRDLHCGLVRWRDGAAGDALWEWRFNFQIHWAEHATSALRAIFALSAWNDFPWPSARG